MVLQFLCLVYFLLHGKIILRILMYVFDWVYFQFLTSYSFIDHFLHLYAVFDAISSNLDVVLSISPSALLMFLSLDTLMSIRSTG